MAKKKTPAQPSPSKLEGNKYDKIVKENLQYFIPVLLQKVLKVEFDLMENPPQLKTQTTKEVEADFVRIIYNPAYPEGCYLHVEFQVIDEKNSDSRMLQYTAIEHHKYQLPVQLHVVYLGNGHPNNITGEVKFSGLHYRYQVHSIDEISYREFISSDTPEEVILSIIANPNGENRASIVRMILERLVQLRGDSKAVWKFINQLKILSMLRNLREETEKQIEDMVISKDIVRQIKEDKMFQLGEKQGIEQGIEQGLKKGLKRGEIKKSIIAIINMDERGFKAPMIAEVLEVRTTFVNQVLREYQHKKEIISLLKKGNPDQEKIAKKLKISPLLIEVISDDLKKEKE